MDVSLFLAQNALKSHRATEVLGVTSCLNRDMTLNTDAVGSALSGKGFHKDVAVLPPDRMGRQPLLGAGGCASAGPHETAAPSRGGSP